MAIDTSVSPTLTRTLAFANPPNAQLPLAYLPAPHVATGASCGGRPGYGDAGDSTCTCAETSTYTPFLGSDACIDLANRICGRRTGVLQRGESGAPRFARRTNVHRGADRGPVLSWCGLEFEQAHLARPGEHGLRCYRPWTNSTGGAGSGSRSREDARERYKYHLAARDCVSTAQASNHRRSAAGVRAS